MTLGVSTHARMLVCGLLVLTRAPSALGATSASAAGTSVLRNTLLTATLDQTQGLQQLTDLRGPSPHASLNGFTPGGATM